MPVFADVLEHGCSCFSPWELISELGMLTKILPYSPTQLRAKRISYRVYVRHFKVPLGQVHLSIEPSLYFVTKSVVVQIFVSEHLSRSDILQVLFQLRDVIPEMEQWSQKCKMSKW